MVVIETTEEGDDEVPVGGEELPSRSPRQGPPQSEGAAGGGAAINGMPPSAAAATARAHPATQQTIRRLDFTADGPSVALDGAMAVAKRTPKKQRTAGGTDAGGQELTPAKSAATPAAQVHGF